jgi:thioredoxin reductase (NADPH)
MTKPVILSVDDDPQVLSAVERDLRRHYQSDYRIVKATSGAEALEAVQQLKQREIPLALFLVDQRMPAMNGTQFLAEAIKYFPEARKVLLTAYADTEAAIASINQIGLDYYLMKPWDPPDQNLYPILDDLLSDWQATVPVPYEGIRVAGTLWSPSSHAVKDFLSRNRIPYLWQDIEHNAQARELLQPDNRALAEKIGLQTQATQPYFDLIIVGAGPAGLGAAVYGGSEGLRTALIEREATGGQAGTSSRIENYLGFPRGLSGADLARRATAQASRFGVEILTTQEVAKVRVDGLYRIAVLGDGSELSCKAMVIASGVTTRTLDVPGVEKLTGAGIYYGAALTEAAHYRGRHVFVIGGANSAGQGAVFFSRYASQVTMLVRGSALSRGMSHYLINQISETPNIEVCLETEVLEAHGENHLEAITTINRKSGETQKLPADALFAFVGAAAHTDMVAGVVERNNAGFILTGPDLIRDGKRPANWSLKRDPYLLETSVPGIFAAGDVRQGAIRRVASAVGEGAVAVSLLHQYLNTV